MLQASTTESISVRPSDPPQPKYFGRGGSLFGVWRGPQSAREVWLVLPPWAEEDKSARRTLTEGAMHLASQGAASLLFCTRGQGDSRGDFARASLSAWLDDVREAIAHAQAVHPNASLHAIGVRGGALLLLELARHLEDREDQQAPLFGRVVLIEPILGGKRVLSELRARQKLRANMTQHEGAASEATIGADESASRGTPQVLDEGREPIASASATDGAPDIVDFDGWAWGKSLRGDIEGWSADSIGREHLTRLAAHAQVLQVGPRDTLAPALERWCKERDVEASVLRAQPFWSLLDHGESSELWTKVLPEVDVAHPETRHPSPAQVLAPHEGESDEAQQALVWRGGRGEALVGVLHRASGGRQESRGVLVLLHGWSGYKSGPHQMLARAGGFFSARGWDVVRFDFAGRGDSDGDASLATLATMAQDTRDVLAWCRQSLGKPEQNVQQNIVLLGLCSGCEVALGALSEEVDEVRALCLWSAPVFAARASAARDNRKRARHLAQYARKLLRPQTYLKLLRGEVNTKAVGSVVTARGGESKNEETGLPGQLPRGWREWALQGFERWLERAYPLLLIYGTADPTTNEALAWYREQIAFSPAPPPRTRAIGGANHSYYGLAWEREVFEATAAWLDEIDAAP
jgi:alpha-beta hydrolase superfamily lysophospholipase